MALDETQDDVAMKSGNTLVVFIDAELTDADKAMLDKIAEVAGPQAAEDDDGVISFTDNIVTVNGHRYSMDVTVELTALGDEEV